MKKKYQLNFSKICEVRIIATKEAARLRLSLHRDRVLKQLNSIDYRTSDHNCLAVYAGSALNNILNVLVCLVVCTFVYSWSG